MIDLEEGYTAEDIAPLLGREPVSGVYVIESTVTGGVYVGQSKDVHFRWLQHLRKLSTGYHVNKALQRDWRYAGKNAFWFTLVEIVDNDRRLRRACERDWMGKFVMQGIPVYNQKNVPSRWWLETSADLHDMDLFDD